MKKFENLQVMNSFSPYLFLTNQVEWNEFVPKYINPIGNHDNLYLQVIGKQGATSIFNPDLLFTIPKFREFWQKGQGILKNVNSDLEFRFYKRDSINKMIPVNENELGDFKLEIGYELHLN